MHKYTTKEQFNKWINGRLQHLVDKEKSLKQEIEKIKEDRIVLHQKLDCDHNPEVSHYKDYYSRIDTYFCKKCGFSVEF